MRLLILTANTGEGHNSAAKAISEYFVARGHDCRIQNGLAFLPRAKSEIICRGHVFFYRKLPKVYGMGYRFEEKQARRHPYQAKLRTAALRSHKRRAAHRRPDLNAFLRQGAYDAVICVHVFAARLLSELRRQGALAIPCFFLATDYTCSPGVNQLDMDIWFIPHAALADEFSSYGIPKEKLLPSGIPVRDAFLRREDRLEARRRLNLPEEKQIVLLSCGSMGAGSMGRLAYLLAESLPENALLIAVCGSNHALEHRLKALVRTPKLRVLGFVDQMPLYMDAADLFLSKPGGLSTTEAMHKGLPPVLINVAPGCETRNMHFLTGLGCALSADGAASLAALARDLLEHGERLSACTRRCAEEFSSDPREAIYRAVTDICEVSPRSCVESV